jgi:transketolase
MTAVVAAETRSMREQAAAAVVERFYADERVAVVLGDISLPLFRPALRHDPARAVNLGIMEQTMVGVAAGFALEGFRPVVHTIAPFLTERALEQIKLDFGYQGLGGVFIGVGGSYDYAESGTTHHGPGDVQAVSTVPRMRVVVPGSAGETDALVRTALAGDGLTYLRTSAAANSASRQLAPGGLTVLRRGAGPTVVAVGPMLERTLAAASGLDATVLYATTVVPLDADVLAREAFYEGTLTAQVAAALAHRPARIVSIGVPRRIHSRYGSYREHDQALGLDVRGLRERFLALAG